ncbi:hypothetical protein BDN72DRAFT_906936 [Pluteus cervinus]|uniref:Uncharacterized protein n=1 Tax=Pluteus cervinus TaxID=181527 RepID=A0ACD3A026_9AGAR|nr:hypothetical protein BDN72DRAFT_906936 [Pluteus cervinus]
MQNLILHVNYEPSSSLAIADFWFEKEVTINIIVKHLQALLVRPTNTDGQDSQNLIQFRQKSFHDFFVRPSASHGSYPFSLAGMNPVSKFFFSLRTHTRKSASRFNIRVVHRSQQLGYTFLYCHDHPPVVFTYEEEARRLHQAYVQNRPTFRGCICLPTLEPIIKLDMSAVRTFKSCGQNDCVINADLLTLCRMTEISMDHFTREWNRREHLRTFSFPILKFLLWLRVMLYGLLSNPSTAFNGTIEALMHRTSGLNWQARCIAVVNGLLCIAVLVNTRWDAVLLLDGSHLLATFLLHQFLCFDTLRMGP